MRADARLATLIRFRSEPLTTWATQRHNMIFLGDGLLQSHGSPGPAIRIDGAIGPSCSTNYDDSSFDLANPARRLRAKMLSASIAAENAIAA